MAKKVLFYQHNAPVHSSAIATVGLIELRYELTHHLISFWSNIQMAPLLSNLYDFWIVPTYKPQVSFNDHLTSNSEEFSIKQLLVFSIQWITRVDLAITRVDLAVRVVRGRNLFVSPLGGAASRYA